MTCKAYLMDETSMNRALKRISHEILERNNGAENLCLIGIMRRGVPLSKMIADYIYSIEGIAVPVGVLDITFYRDDLSHELKDPVINKTDIDFNIDDKTVILVDDVLYTGRTTSAALDALKKIGRAGQVQLAILIDRGHRELPIRGDYIGKNVPTSQNEYISVKVPPYDDRMCVELFDLKENNG